MRHITLIITIVALAFAAPAFSGKGGVPNGGSGNGGGNGNAGSNDGNGSQGGGGRDSGWLIATPNVVHAGEYFDVSGCEYDTNLGNVVLGYGGGGWGSPLDASGCFSIPNIPVGDGAPPGTYPVTAYQYVGDKLTKTAETAVTVVE